MATPFLEREARLIRLTQALAPLSLSALADPAARHAAYAAFREDLGAVGAAEDAEAARRSEFYWRRIRPGGVAAVAPGPAPRRREMADA